MGLFSFTGDVDSLEFKLLAGGADGTDDEFDLLTTFSASGADATTVPTILLFWFALKLITEPDRSCNCDKSFWICFISLTNNGKFFTLSMSLNDSSKSP